MNTGYQIFLTAILLLFWNLNTSGQENIAPLAVPTTSCISGWEKLSAINDQYEPKSSGDKGPGAYGNWNGETRYNQWNWVTYEWNDFFRISKSDVYWWSDGGGIQLPYQTSVQYWDNFLKEWVTPENVAGNGLLPNQYNTTTFDAVVTNKIRLNFISLAAQGILEWKIYGMAENDFPSGSTATITSTPEKGKTSVVSLKALTGEGKPISNYRFKVGFTVKNQNTKTAEKYIIDGQSLSGAGAVDLPPTNSDGEVQFDMAIPARVDFHDGVSLSVLLQDGITRLTSYNYLEPGKTPPVLTADTIENDVEHPVEILFTDQPAWRKAINKILVDEVVLPSADYQLEKGKCILKPAHGNISLTRAGLKNIRIEATDYEPVSIQQEIKAGTISLLHSKVDNKVKLYRPSTTRLNVQANDAYGNPIRNYTFKYHVQIKNANSTTAEKYLIDGIGVSPNALPGEMRPTNSDGLAQLSVTVPPQVDIEDGILFQFFLNDGKTGLPTEPGYICREGEREVYVPNDIKILKEFSWDCTAQSEHFTAFWGAKTGPDPLHPSNGGVTFDPQPILDELESYYHFYIDSMKFILNPDSGNMARYKSVIVLFNTWNEGYADNGAYGASVDDMIGAMWMTPRSGFVIAHEFGHACQALIPIQYPGKGFKNIDDTQVVGMYWEACANYMAYLSTGKAGNILSPLFLNTSMLQYLSTIDYRQYESVYFPAYLIDQYGREFLGKQWRAADVGDNPFDAYQKARGLTREEMRREAGLWAMHNVTWDYTLPARSYFKGLDPTATCREYTYLQTINGVPGKYIVPREMAPADYGYNIIPVFPDAGVNEISAKLTGYENKPAGGGGWSYGFVAEDANGLPRYGRVALESDEKASLTIQPSDKKFYLVVLATPLLTHTYTWTPSWTKVFRFPYALSFVNAQPAGHKKAGNNQKATVPGAPHSNGGGWVASTARVDASAFVGPDAQVLDNALVQDNARIEDFAVVTDNAVIKGQARIRGNAIVGKEARIEGNALVEKAARVYNGSVSDHGVVTGSAVAQNCTITGNAVLKEVAWLKKATLSGTALVGGDMTRFSNCDEGIYQQLSRTACDSIIWDSICNDINQPVGHYQFPFGDIPTPPAHLKARLIKGNSVVLNWNPSLDNDSILHYIVLLNGKARQIASTNSATLVNLEEKTNYFIQVLARDCTGNLSLASEEIKLCTKVSKK